MSPKLLNLKVQYLGGLSCQLLCWLLQLSQIILVLLIKKRNNSYAVEVTQNGCVDTSACEQVNNVGINEINSSITLHPNPTNSIVELQGINGSFKVDVYDYAGKYLQSTSRSTIDLSDYPSGIYFLKVAYGDKTEELRVVKE